MAIMITTVLCKPSVAAKNSMKDNPRIPTINIVSTTLVLYKVFAHGVLNAQFSQNINPGIPKEKRLQALKDLKLTICLSSGDNSLAQSGRLRMNKLYSTAISFRPFFHPWFIFLFRQSRRVVLTFKISRLVETGHI